VHPIKDATVNMGSWDESPKELMVKPVGQGNKDLLDVVSGEYN